MLLGAELIPGLDELYDDCEQGLAGRGMMIGLAAPTATTQLTSVSIPAETDDPGIHRSALRYALSYISPTGHFPGVVIQLG